MKCFIDTNIWLYQLMYFDPADTESLKKQRIADGLLTKLADDRNVVISCQVMGEFFTAATRKGVRPLSHFAASREVNFMTVFEVVPTTRGLVRLAIERVQGSRISYYDALIVEAALRAGCSILYTEDLHHGVRFDTLEVRNPFLP